MAPATPSGGLSCFREIHFLRPVLPSSVQQLSCADGGTAATATFELQSRQILWTSRDAQANTVMLEGGGAVSGGAPLRSAGEREVAFATAYAICHMDIAGAPSAGPRAAVAAPRLPRVPCDVAFAVVSREPLEGRCGGVRRCRGCVRVRR